MNEINKDDSDEDGFLPTDKTGIEEALAEGDEEVLRRLGFSVGEWFPDWKYAQDVCLRLAEHPNEQIRANACLGLGYIARTKRMLEKHLVKPVLLRELRTQEDFNWRGNVINAIEDINQFLGWNLAKSLRKE